MFNTSSLAWPNMFGVSTNKVNVLTDNRSVVNRNKLLILTDPTEVYNSPTFGVGLKRYLWQYNTINTKAMIQDRIKNQLDMYEPRVDAEKTTFADGLMFSGEDSSISAQEFNQLKMTVGLQTTYGETLSIDLDFDNLQDKIDFAQKVYQNLADS